MKPIFRLALATILTFGGACAFASQSEKSHEIRCEEVDATESDGDTNSSGQSLAQIKVSLDANGNAETVQIQRPAGDGLPAIATVFDRKNSTITHASKKTGDNAETGECQTAYCIAEIETISVDAGAIGQLTLRLNDHAYAGAPGSSFALTIGKVKVDTQIVGHMLGCEGHLRFPWESPSPEDLLK